MKTSRAVPGRPLKEWTENDFKSVYNYVVSNFPVYPKKVWNKKLYRFDFEKTTARERVDNHFGLAYTSSSSFAGLWVCNIEHKQVIKDTEYSLTGFCFNGEEVFEIWDDKEENTLYVNRNE